MANQFQIQLPPDFEKRYPNSSVKATECAMNLVRTADLLLKLISQLLKQFDLTPASALVVSMLADSEPPLSPNEIADRLIISRATVTGLIDSLERREFVRRLPHLTDRRMLLVELTEKGKQVAIAFRPVVHQHQKEWFEALNDTQQQQLIDSLHQLQDGFSDSNP